MSISKHSNGLASTIDFKCSRKIFQRLPYLHTHNIPGGQYTNLFFQSKKIGLTYNFGDEKIRARSWTPLEGQVGPITGPNKVSYGTDGGTRTETVSKSYGTL